MGVIVTIRIVRPRAKKNGENKDGCYGNNNDGCYGDSEEDGCCNFVAITLKKRLVCGFQCCQKGKLMPVYCL